MLYGWYPDTSVAVSYYLRKIRRNSSGNARNTERQRKDRILTAKAPKPGRSAQAALSFPLPWEPRYRRLEGIQITRHLLAGNALYEAAIGS